MTKHGPPITNAMRSGIPNVICGNVQILESLHINGVKTDHV